MNKGEAFVRGGGWLKQVLEQAKADVKTWPTWLKDDKEQETPMTRENKLCPVCRVRHGDELFRLPEEALWVAFVHAHRIALERGERIKELKELNNCKITLRHQKESKKLRERIVELEIGLRNTGNYHRTVDEKQKERIAALEAALREIYRLIGTENTTRSYLKPVEAQIGEIAKKALEGKEE